MCPSGEEAMTVAFHPSGFHLVVAFADKILLMNVLSSDLKEYHSITAKGVKEIQFSTGGHIFICGL